jgi:hypothetical protein
MSFESSQLHCQADAIMLEQMEQMNTVLMAGAISSVLGDI